MGWIALQQLLDHRAAKSSPEEAKHLLFADQLNESEQVRLKQLERTIDSQIERQLLRAPVLAVDVRPIPEAENGYFQLIQWLNQDTPKPQEFPSSINAMRSSPGAWDEAAVNAWLNETEAIRAELHRIGSLRECSASGVPITHGLRSVQQNARTLSHAIDMLILEAEAHLHIGNFHPAFVSIRTAIGITYHIDHHEHATLQHATIANQGRDRILTILTQHAMPRLIEAKAPLDNWVALIRATNRTSVPLDRLARGEWHTDMHLSLVPNIYATKRRYIPDPDVVIDVWTDRFCYVVSQVEPSFERKKLPLPEISKQGLAFLAKAQLGDSFTPWMKGYDQSVVRSTLVEAAFLLAQLEAQGKSITEKEALAQLPVDPSTEAAFAFDPSTRTLSSTASGVPPVTIPTRP